MARIGQVPKSQLYAGPGYNLFEVPPRQRREFEEETTFLRVAAITGAAEAVRAAEIEAVGPKNTDSDDTDLDSTHLDSMNIDELRIVARLLEVPDREQFTDRDELVSAIERCL